MEFNGRGTDLHSIVGFSPSWPARLGSRNALYGIARRLRIELYDPPLSDAAAERALIGNPRVLSEFKQTFPWIEMPS